MEFGIGYFPTHDAAGPGEVARLVEEHGFESLFFAEHTHIPASRETPYAGGGELPRKYLHTYDLFVALTAAAAATSRLRIGSGVCLVIEHDPIVARQAGRVGRPPLRRPLRVRRRRRLEPRGDAEPRNRPADAHAPAEGAGRGDEGDLD